MSNIHIYFLLDTISKEGSLQKLLDLNLTYSQIAAITSEVIESGLITDKEKKFVLTEEGKTLLNQLKKKYRPLWIEQDLNFKIPQIDVDSIYLPKRSGLSFKLQS
jgi:hypothetical protein